MKECNKRVLVATLYCGENEFEQCCNSVSSQKEVNIVHKVFKFLPKQEAHQKLYQLFNESRDDFDYLAKLDADMAFSNPDALKRIIDEFHEGVDVVSSTVYDGITGSDMQSFNIFSSNCYFHFRDNDPLYTDKLKIDYPGRHYSYIDKQRNVLHAFAPSPFQAFMFGVHRALKVVQPGRKAPRLSNSYHQRIILNKVYKNFIQTQSNDAKYALWGATLVFKQLVKSPSLIQKDDYREVFEHVLSSGGVELDHRLTQSDFFSLVKVLGLGRFLNGSIYEILRKIGVVE